MIKHVHVVDTFQYSLVIDCIGGISVCLSLRHFFRYPIILDQATICSEKVFAPLQPVKERWRYVIIPRLFRINFSKGFNLPKTKSPALNSMIYSETGHFYLIV